jgi:hypothetical protein
LTEVARRPLEAEQCALVVVDIQEKLLPPIFNKETLVKNSQLLIRLAKILSIPVMVTTQYSKGLGSTVPDIASLLTDVPAFDKLEFSCFGSDQFRTRLKSLPGSRNTVLLCGHGDAHLRDADSAGRAERRVFGARRLRCSGIARGMELEDWS